MTIISCENKSKVIKNIVNEIKAHKSATWQSKRDSS